ncbi:hypothetical protein [Siccirubricoccus phaeus]|uniref:hypothetical protein n=1 Tax=Siccirubricoccus phaeus TaxID=2595053 RepID=UPI0011F32031|nr:hypothetical protein [Siccirubricoccus phaeus]
MTGQRPHRPPAGFAAATGPMPSVAGGDGSFPLVGLGGAAAAAGALCRPFPHGPQFAFGAANGPAARE